MNKNHSQMIIRALAILVILLAAVQQSSIAQVPGTISFQGLLTDNAGVNVPDGSYGLSFRLYTAATGGTAFWFESHQAVPVKNGVFNIILGSITPLDGLRFDAAYWIGVTVGTSGEMVPRTVLTSSPYALNARAVIGTANVFPSAGNVGIGKSNPQFALDVAGTTNTSSFKMPTNAAAGAVLTSDAVGEGRWLQLPAVGLLVEQVTAKRSTRNIEITLTNPNSAAVTLEKAAVSTTVGKTVVSDLQLDTNFVVTELQKTSVDVASPPLPPLTVPTWAIPDNFVVNLKDPATVPTWDIPKLLERLIQNNGHCAPGCMGCLLTLAVVEWDPAEVRGLLNWMQARVHEHDPVWNSVELRGLLQWLQNHAHRHTTIPVINSVEARTVKVAGIDSVVKSGICSVVEGIYEAPLVIQPGARITLTIDMNSVPVWGCRIDMLSSDYLRIALFDQAGMQRAGVLAKVL